MTGSRQPISLPGIVRRRVGILYAALAIALGVSPLGCGTLVGYGIGQAIDESRFEDLPGPYTESLAPMTGRVLQATIPTKHTITGELVGVEARSGGDDVCLIRSERQTPIPGRESRVDTVAVASILAVQVARDSHAYRDAGVLTGFIADAAVICILSARVGSVGAAVSK
jgi:hypothetical protein